MKKDELKELDVNSLDDVNGGVVLAFQKVRSVRQVNKTGVKKQNVSSAKVFNNDAKRQPKNILKAVDKAI